MRCEDDGAEGRAATWDDDRLLDRPVRPATGIWVSIAAIVIGKEENETMPIAISADVPGQTKEGYEETIRTLGRTLKEAPGFIMHFGHPIDGGWRVVEVWESAKDASEWFAKYVRPNLPPGIRPQRHVQELHTLIQK